MYYDRRIYHLVADGKGGVDRYYLSMTGTWTKRAEHAVKLTADAAEHAQKRYGVRVETTHSPNDPRLDLYATAIRDGDRIIPLR